MGLHEMWSQGSRRTGGSPSGREPGFKPKRWPLKPSAKVPTYDPNQDQEDSNPAHDKSASGGSTSGEHGTGTGRNGRDTDKPSAQDVTVRRNEHHHDDRSEPHDSTGRDLHSRRGIRGLRSRKRDDSDYEEMSTQPDPETDPEPNASVHTAAGISMSSFTSAGEKDSPRLPGTTPLRYITPSKRPRAGLGASRSRKLPGKDPVTSPLPCPGCQGRGM